MSIMTIRLPDEKHLRLKQLAKSRHLSINKLIEELATSILSAHDAEVRFRALALRGNTKKALALLDKLDNKQKKNESLTCCKLSQRHQCSTMQAFVSAFDRKR